MPEKERARIPLCLAAALCVAVVFSDPTMWGRGTLRADEPRRGADRLAESADAVETVPVSSPRALTPRVSKAGAGTKRPDASATGGAWWTTMGGLAVVLCVVGGLAWLARKHLPAAARGLPTAAVEILGRRTIEPRAAVHLVRCGNRILLLGSSPAGLTTLTEFSDPEEVDHLSGICRADEESQMSFLQLFRKAESQPTREFTVRGPEPLAEEEGPTMTAPEEIAVERVRRKLGQGPGERSASSA